MTGNVHAIRPLRILLATDDLTYADELMGAAARLDVGVVLVSGDDDLEAATREHRPTVVLIDARGTLPRAVRSATLFEARHPELEIVLLASREPAREPGNLRVVDEGRSADQLVADLLRAQIGLASAPERSGA